MLVGATHAELQENFGFLSMPLGWASPRFVITPRMSFFGVVGVIFVNSYLYAILLFPCVRLVQASMRRNRVTQLGISNPIEHFDTYEEDSTDDEGLGR